MQDPLSSLPVLIISGASGFIGRHLIQALRDDFFIYALARRSQKAAEILPHPNVAWCRVDITREASVKELLNTIAAKGGADFFIHLAGYYDFSNKPSPEYNRTNVQGTHYVLRYCEQLGLKRFIFSSSLAAFEFTRVQQSFNEQALPDAGYPYALSKRAAEDLVRKYSELFPCAIVRLAAIFSDWSEYVPLYYFLSTWISQRWDRRILVGKGEARIPYLHIRDLVRFVRCILNRTEQLPTCAVLHAAPNESVSQRQLFEIANRYLFFRATSPLYLNKYLVAPGIVFRLFKGWLTHKPPFERLWMLRYADKALDVESRQTRNLLDWQPSQHYEILRRLLFIVDNMKSNPYRWNYLNHRRIVQVTAIESRYLKIYEVMMRLKPQIIERIVGHLGAATRRFQHYQKMSPDALYYCVECMYNMLEIDVRTGDRSHILDYARNLAERRFREDFTLEEVQQAIQLTSDEIIQTLAASPELEGMQGRIHEEVYLTLQMVGDAIEDSWLQLLGRT